ncbi:MAG: hypothetical protein QMD44_11580 [Thermodesulfovibrionales bacterium]|jgi:hypothetical protein|nr:hypothetical protein [Thermodesulfovibrionales bacterium]
MNRVQEVVVLSLLSGALGGIASYLHMAYGGFKTLPTKSPSQSEEMKKQRLYFLILRVVFGAISGFIIALWFIDNFEQGTLSETKLSFISAIAGFSTVMLASISKTISKYIGRSVDADFTPKTNERK